MRCSSVIPLLHWTAHALGYTAGVAFYTGLFFFASASMNYELI